MIKTNTKKKSSPKKTPAVAAKAPVAKKVAPTKKAPVAKSSAPKKVTPTKKVTSKVISSSQKTTSPATKKPVPKKVATPRPKTEAQPIVSTEKSKEGVKMLGILHLVGNLFSGGVLGILLVIIYYFFQHEKISRLEKEACFEIINFNLSFVLYMGIAVGLIFAIIGVILIPVVWLTWFILLIVGFLSHLSGDNYRYPLTIRFIS